jgi:hypothetical protein
MGACPPSPARRKSPLAKCDRQAFAAFWFIARTFAVATPIAISGDQWPDHVRLSDLELRFVCKACGKRGADIRPDFDWNKKPVAMMGYR